MNPVWTRDGSRIVFLGGSVDARVLYAVHLVNGRPDNSRVEVLTSDVAMSRLHGFTPDGALLYTVSDNPSDAYTADLDAGGRLISGPVRLNKSFTGLVQGRIAWSPDGHLLSYAWYGERDRGFVIRSTETGEERPVPNAQYAGYAGWFPDSRTLLAGPVAGDNGKMARIDVWSGAILAVHDVARTNAKTLSANAAWFLYPH